MKITPVFGLSDEKFVIFDEYLIADDENEGLQKAIEATINLPSLGLYFTGQFINLDQNIKCFLMKIPYPGSGITIEIGLVNGPTFNQLKMVEDGHEDKDAILKQLKEEIAFFDEKYIRDNVFVMEMINLSEENLLMVCIGVDADTSKPYILLKAGDGDYQITPSKARELAWDLIMASGAAIEDGFMFKFLNESRPDLDITEKRQSIDAFRNYREEVLREQEQEDADTDT